MIPAEIIMGEAGICSIQAMVAIAYVYSRNPKMNGWQAKVSAEARAVSLFWQWLPDTSNGAKFAFSFEDLKQRAVKAIIREKSLKAYFKCEFSGLVFY